MPKVNSSLEALRLLERALAQLEQHVDQFNIFEALRIARTEIRHSNFLAWLLDPDETHQCGTLFLKELLGDIATRLGSEQEQLRGVLRNSNDWSHVRVEREWEHIDIIVQCRNPEFAVVIENKIDAKEHGDQLQRYGKVAEREFDASTVVLVFLTAIGTRASQERWIVYGYEDLHNVLIRCHEAIAKQKGGQDIQTVLGHYINLIRSWFMSDSKVDAICRQIYTRHRKALELIERRVNARPLPFLEDIESTLREIGGDWYAYRGKTEITLTPKSWLNQLPKLLDPTGHDDWILMDRGVWLSFYLSVTATELKWHFWLGPIADKELSRKVLEKLVVAFRDERKIRRPVRKPPFNSDLCAGTVLNWRIGTLPDADQLRGRLAECLKTLSKSFGKVPAIIKPALDGHVK